MAPGHLGPQFVGDLQTRIVNEEDWANAWKDYYHVTHIGHRLVIRPSWRILPPKTTKSCWNSTPAWPLAQACIPQRACAWNRCERYTRPGCTCSNMGTGSGILALAAAKLGAASVYCIDNSSVAVESATANVAANSLSDRITVALGILDEAEATRMAGQYDLVLANIIARVIGSIASYLAQVLAPGGSAHRQRHHRRAPSRSRAAPAGCWFNSGRYRQHR